MRNKETLKQDIDLLTRNIRLLHKMKKRATKGGIKEIEKSIQAKERFLEQYKLLLAYLENEN
jgi:hypothetical protein